VSQLNIVQIGSSTGGDAASDFFACYEEFIGLGILIDASPESVEATEEYYKNNFPTSLHEDRLIYSNYAIVADPLISEIQLFRPEGQPTSEYSSVFKSHVDAHRAGHHKDAVPVLVPATTLKKVVDKYKLSRIDRLYLDAEGMDADILLSLDLSSMTIPYIVFEHGHTDGPFSRNEKWKNLLNLFWSNDYQVFLTLTRALQFDYNAWAIRKDFLSCFNIGVPVIDQSGNRATMDGVPILDVRTPHCESLTVFRTEKNNFNVEKYLDLI
tara:strand:+ start:1918 stop:2721 length:804 start_codon:yes stop_codon:yes gene_type:complete